MKLHHPLRHFRSAAVAAVVLAIAGCGGAQTRLQGHMERGKEYLAAENLEKARVEFGNALQIAPNDADARYYSGVVAEKLGKIRDAVGMYQVAIDSRPEHDAARAALGRVYVFGGAPDRALEVVAPGLQRNADDPELLTVRAAARAQQKDATAAMQDAARAVELAPGNENAVALLASLHRQAGENGEAIELVEKTLAKLPKSVDLRQILASLYVTVGDLDRAIATQRALIAQRPGTLAFRTQLALLQLRAKQVDAAEATLRESVTALPESVEAKVSYVDFLASQRTREVALETMRRYADAKPDDHALRLALGDLQRRAARNDDARATFAAVIESAGDKPAGLTARTRIASLDVEAGKFDAAGKLVGEVLAKNPRDVDALLLRGNLALQRSDAAAAIADLRAVLRDQPGSVGVMRTLARAHLANGDPALAEDQLRAAIEVAPEETTAKLELAQLLLQTQRAEAAITLLEQVVVAAPGDAPSRELLARAYLSKGDLAAARTTAEDLRTLRPDLAVGHYLAGLVAQSQSRFDDAQSGYEKALELQPNAMDALAALVRLDVTRGQGARALQRVERVIAAEPRNAIAVNLATELKLAARDYPKAATYASQAVSLAPKWPVAHRNLGLARLGAGDAERALAAFRDGVAATGHDPGLVTEYAALLERSGRVDDAIAAYEELRKRDPRLPLAANNLAMLLVTHKSGDRASLDRAYELVSEFGSSPDAFLLDTYGWVRLVRGEVAEALPALERASQKAPASKVIRYHLAMAQLKAGQRDRARLNLEDAIAGAQPFAGIDEARSVLTELRRRG